MMKPTILLTSLLVLATLFGVVAIAQDADTDDDDFEFVGQQGDGNETAENETADGNETVKEDKGGDGKGAEKRNETGGERSTRSFFGLCNAWDANENGRENGNASQSSAFTWLFEQAGGAIDAFCGDVDHPSEQASGKADDARRGSSADAPNGNATGHERKADQGENGKDNGQGHGKGKPKDDESDE